MNCVNHAGTAASAACVACAESFCEDCLVSIGGSRYCGSCKVEAIKTLPPPDTGLVPCKEADDALRLVLFSIFCFGILLGPLAIAKANKARRRIDANPALMGSGKVIATYVVGSLVLFLWVFNILAKALAQ